MRHLISSIAFLAMALAIRAQEETPARTLNLYDIRDLVFGRIDFPGVDISLARDAVNSGAAVKGGEPPLDPYAPAVRALIGPTSTVELKDGVLSVRATEEEHRSIREFLGLYRRRLGQLVSVEAQFIQTAVDLREGAPAASFTRLSAPEAEVLRQRVQAGKGQILMSPRLTLFSGQLGYLFVGDQMACVREIELAADAAGKIRTEPRVEAAKTGLHLDLRAVVKNAEKEEVLLENLQFVLVEPREKGKVRTIETPYGKVEDPEVLRFKVTHRSSSLKSGESLLGGPFSKPWSGKDDPKIWLLLRAKVIVLPEVDPVKKK